MKTISLTLAQIGKSRGIRLPAELIRKHGLEHGLVLEDRGHELALRPRTGAKKLSWEQTYQEMAAAGEDWSDWSNPVPGATPETYDFSAGVRGKYAARDTEGANVVVLEPDVAKAFPNAAAVNESLRALAARLPTSSKPV